MSESQSPEINFTMPNQGVGTETGPNVNEPHISSPTPESNEEPSPEPEGSTAEKSNQSTPPQTESPQPEQPASETPKDYLSEDLRTPEQIKLEGRTHDARELSQILMLKKYREIPLDPKDKEKRTRIPRNPGEEEIMGYAALQKIASENGRVTLGDKNKSKPLSEENPMNFPERPPQVVLENGRYRAALPGEQGISLAKIVGVQRLKQGENVKSMFICRSTDNPTQTIQIPFDVVLDAQMSIAMREAQTHNIFTEKETQIVDAHLTYVQTGNAQKALDLDQNSIDEVIGNEAGNVVSAAELTRCIETAQPFATVSGIINPQSEDFARIRDTNRERQRLLDRMKGKNVASPEDISQVLQSVGKSNIDLERSRVNLQIAEYNRKIQNLQKDNQDTTRLKTELGHLHEYLQTYDKALETFKNVNSGSTAIESYITRGRIGEETAESMKTFKSLITDGNVQEAILTIAEAENKKIPSDKRKNLIDLAKEHPYLSLTSVLGLALAFLAIQQALREQSGQ